MENRNRNSFANVKDYEAKHYGKQKNKHKAL